MFITPADAQPPIVRSVDIYPEIAHRYQSSNFTFDIPQALIEEQLRRRQDNILTITETEPEERYCVLNENGIRDSKTHENIISDENWRLPFIEQPENIFALQFQDDDSMTLIFFLNTGCIVKDSESNDIVFPPIVLGSINYDQNGAASDFIQTSFLSNIANLLNRDFKDDKGESTTVLHMRVTPFEESKVITLDAYIEKVTSLDENGTEEVFNQPVIEILPKSSELLDGQEINILEPSMLTEIIESLVQDDQNDINA